jgi:xylitol oxidase
MKNWCGLVEFGSVGIAEPTSLGEVQAVVAGADRVRALGTAHCFNDIADTAGLQVNVGRLPVDLAVDSETSIARIGAGIRFGDLAALLAEQGWALPNMASLGHISVAGSVATGTHGSGDRNQTLSAGIRWLQLVTAGGDVLEVDSFDPRFAGMVVGLGSLGVVTRIGIAVQPAYEIRQYVFDGITHEQIRTSFDEVFSSAYSVSFFTTWGPELAGQVWMKRRDGVDGPWSASQWMGGRLCETKQHPLPGHDPMHCTEQGGVPGPSFDRLPHFKLDFTPSSGDEIQTEYLVPRDQAAEVLAELESLAPRIQPLLHISEVRTMAADDLWLSGAYGRETVGVHFTWHKDVRALDLLPELDSLFGSHGGRAHWGKVHVTPPSALADRYPRLEDFMGLRSDLDPAGKFRNGHLDWLY